MNDFEWDVCQKKRIARGAKNMKSKRGKRGCMLPSDYLSKRQIKELNGEVISVNFNEQLTYEDFKKLSDDSQKEYYDALLSRINTPSINKERIKIMETLKIEYIAIQNKKTKRLVAGSDSRYDPCRQRYMSKTLPPMLFDSAEGAQKYIDRVITNPDNFKFVTVVFVIKDIIS